MTRKLALSLLLLVILSAGWARPRVDSGFGLPTAPIAQQSLANPASFNLVDAKWLGKPEELIILAGEQGLVRVKLPATCRGRMVQLELRLQSLSGSLMPYLTGPDGPIRQGTSVAGVGGACALTLAGRAPAREDTFLDLRLSSGCRLQVERVVVQVLY